MNIKEPSAMDSLFDKYINKLGYMRDRWQDEKEYEDFDEYKKVVKEIFEEFGFTKITLSKGFVVKCKNEESTREWQVKIQARGVKVTEYAMN